MVRIRLKFINDGKPFEIGTWTTEKHERALELLLKNTKDVSEEERTKEFKYYVIYVALKEVDKNLDFATIKNLHVENVADLFNLIYNAGKLDIIVEDSVDGDAPKKSIGKKN